MEVKPGYKQTEVGVIPGDWEVRTLEATTDCLDNLRVPLNESQRAKRHGDIPYCGANGVLDHIDDFVIDDDIILMAEDGGYFDEYLTRPIAYRMTGKCWVNNHAHILQAKAGHDQGFIYYSLVHKNILRFLASGTRAKLNRSELNKIELSLPPTKAEQEAIAEALSDADALIESLEELLAKKGQLKQGVMQDLLTGKKRLSGFSGEWEMCSLGSIADPNQRWSFTGGPFGSNLKSSDYTEVGVRIIQLQNIGDGEFKDDYEIYTSRQKADELLNCSIYPGEIILSKMGDPVARACIIPPFQERYVMCSDGIRLAVDKKRFKTYFVYTQINAPAFRGKAANAGTGSTRKRIGLTELRGLELRCPPLPEQTAIAAILSDMDADIAALEAKLAKARSIKGGMMQELLTGRIRLV